MFLDFDFDLPLDLSFLLLWKFLDWLFHIYELLEIRASTPLDLERVPISFLLASSLSVLSLTISMVRFPFGAELLREITKVSQLSGNELSNKSACNSSWRFIFMVVNWFTSPWKSLRCSVILSIHPWISDFASLLIKEALFWTVYRSYIDSKFFQSTSAFVSLAT